MTPEQRSLRAKLAAHSRWAATNDRTAATAPARKAWHDRWEKQVDPDLTLPPAERALRANHAMQAHMLRMSLTAATRRRKQSSTAAKGRAS